MRTISITLINKTDFANEVRVSTEVIVEEGAELEAGVDAQAALSRFIDGYTRE